MQFRALVTVPPTGDVDWPAECPFCGHPTPDASRRVRPFPTPVGSLTHLLMPPTGSEKGDDRGMRHPVCSSCLQRWSRLAGTASMVGWLMPAITAGLILLLPLPGTIPAIAMLPLYVALAWGPLLAMRHLLPSPPLLRQTAKAREFHFARREYAKEFAAANSAQALVRRIGPVELDRSRVIAMASLPLVIIIILGTLSRNLAPSYLAPALKVLSLAAVLGAGPLLFQPFALKRKKTWLKPDADIFHQVRVDRSRVANHKPPSRKAGRSLRRG